MAMPIPPPGQLPQYQSPQHASPSYDASSYPSSPSSPISSNNASYYPQPEPNAADSFAFKSPEPIHRKISKYVTTRYQLLLDLSTPYPKARWAFSLGLLFLFMVRILVSHGWYVICYGLSIYYLNLFIGFLSPKIDPAFQADMDFSDPADSAIGPMLPTKASDEFRPFIRRLPEFKFWLSATSATLTALFLTLFRMFDLPVFWPILLLYFILLFACTMRQQIRHMIKYGYVPWDKGKKKYGGQVDDSAKLYPTTI